MRQWSQNQKTVLIVLADGKFHTHRELAQLITTDHLGSSEISLECSKQQTLEKCIKQFIKSGIPILYVPEQGYRLQQPLKLLDEKKINSLLHNQLNQPYQLHVFGSIDSTNRYLKEIPESNILDICCTEQQTQGRGRFERVWHSPFGENIYCSSRWQFKGGLKKFSGLSLVTSLAIIETLKPFNQNNDIKIKWPNDILWQDKKLCGSLIEIVSSNDPEQAQIVIGIGLNVNSDTKNSPLFDKPWCSLFELTQTLHDRNTLIAQLTVQLERYLKLFMAHDLNVFKEQWLQYDYLKDKEITVTQGNKQIQGIACGINEMGQLILKNNQGQTIGLSSGDTTLRSKKD